MAFLFSILLFILLPLHSFAAARLQIEAPDKSGPAGKPLEVKVKLMESDADDSKPSVGEKAEFKVKDPKDGQFCTTNPAGSDSEGYVYGTCQSDTDTSMQVYASSKDRGDSSNDMTLTFTEKESDNSDRPPSAKSNPFQKQNQPQQMNEQNAGSTLANQPGMKEDKPLMEGLHEAKDDGFVAGAADTAPPAAAPTNDLDLLNSLIYLTGGIVLLIAGIYFIYIQSRNASRKKKGEAVILSEPDNSKPAGP